MSKYKGVFNWGALNGILFGILLKYGNDISQEGFLTTFLDTLRPLVGEFGLHLTAIKIIVVLAGIYSLYKEALNVYDRGWIAITFAVCGFLGIFLLVLGIDFGVVFLIIVMLMFFAEQQRWI